MRRFPHRLLPACLPAFVWLGSCASVRPPGLVAEASRAARPPPDPAAIREALAESDSGEHYVSARALSHYLAGMHARETGDDAQALVELRLAALYDAQGAWPRYALAGELARQGDARQAEAVAREALSLEPDHAPTLMLLARLEAARRRTTRALALLRHAARADPDDPRPWSETARVRVQRGEWSAAVAAVERMDSLPVRTDASQAAARRTAEAFASIGRAMEHAGLDTGAEELLRRAASRDPSDAHRWTDLAAFLESRERNAEAAEAMDRAVAPARAGPGLVASAARLHLKAGNRAAARALLARLIGTDPRDRQLPTALTLAARAFLDTGDGVGAEEAVRAATDLEAPERDTLPLLAAAQEAQGRWQEALATWSRVRPDAPAATRARAHQALCRWRLGEREDPPAALRTQAEAGSADAALVWAQVLAEEGAKSEAIEVLERAREEGGAEIALALAGLLGAEGRCVDAAAVLDESDDRGEWERIVLAVADACERAGEPAEAIPALVRQARAHPRRAEAPMRLARLLLRGGADADLASAETFARRALSLRPDDVRALDLAGEVLLRRARPEEALRLLERAAALGATDAQVQVHLAQAQAAAGHPGEARAAYARAATLARERGDTALSDEVARALDALASPPGN